jgi:phosphate transport system protein
LASGENVRVTFQEELDQLEATLQEEGALVLRTLRGALNALAQRDVELADDVISFDDDVDRLYLHIENEIESLLARQTPVATDLRLVLALLHVNLHLERMADYSVTIAKLTKLVADVEPDGMLLQSLEEMGERAEEMIRVALDSLANRDLEAAESLVDLDELIDRSNRRFVERVVEIVAEPGLREGAPDGARLADDRAHRRPRGGHRRAGGVSVDRRVQGVHRRVAPRARLRLRR